MGADSKIEWTHHTFNPWWGCVEDGAECDNCYARVWSNRLGMKLWGTDAPRRFFRDLRWGEPLVWNRVAGEMRERHRVFCASMADIGERRNDLVGADMDLARARLWELIEGTPNLDWLLLTKRPQNLMALFPARWLKRMPRHVWVGTTAGTRRRWQTHVKYLRRLPGDPAVRFVSIEPILEDLGELDLSGIDWGIVGTESGHGARWPGLDALHGVVGQFAAADKPLFTKQIANEHDKKGGDPQHWPAGDWPRDYPDVDFDDALENLRGLLDR